MNNNQPTTRCLCANIVRLAAIILHCSLFTIHCSLTNAQTIEMLPFGDMDQWVVREIKESAVIGGNTKYVYAIAPNDTLRGNVAYHNIGGSPWGTSNVMAKVSGVVKTNTSVFPDRHGDGLCARLDTRMESVKVLGLVNITVLAAGSIFLGEMHEPIRGTRNPMKMLGTGVPFTRRPKALMFDYKVQMSDREKRIRATGFSRITDVDGRDLCEVVLLLQKRWEDKLGNVYAKRVATLRLRFDATTNGWVEDATYPLLYGDITQHPDYDPQTMRIQEEERYCINSQGESVLINEIGWAEPDEEPTHLFIQFASSHGGAYIGSPGNSFYVDNVRLVY